MAAELVFWIANLEGFVSRTLEFTWLHSVAS